MKRAAYWNETSDYYNRLARQNERYSQLTSPEVTKASLEASNREAELKKRRDNLEDRRQRLKNLLTEEQSEYQAELDKLPAGSVKPITDLREEREKMRKEREEVMRKEAELKMLQHWKINNPRFREQERTINNFTVRQQLQEQIQEKKEREEQERRENEAYERQMLAEEQRKINEALRLEEERKLEIARLHQDLERQMVELRTRQREMEVWKRTRAEQEELQRRVEMSDFERKKMEKLREGRELETYQKRQHRLKLKMKTKQVQEDLEDDRRRLAEMEALSRSQDDCHEDKKRKAIADVQWMLEVVRKQQEEEQRRDKELEMMFAEEAAKMWEKQEEIWAREEKARNQLMAEVTDSWRAQLEQRTSAAQLVVDHEQQRMAEIEADIRDLNQHIMNKERMLEQRRESLVEALDGQMQEKEARRLRSYQEQEQEVMRERQEEIREENKLARNLASLSVNMNQEQSSISDFRRRKVRWFY